MNHHTSCLSGTWATMVGLFKKSVENEASVHIWKDGTGPLPDGRITLARGFEFVSDSGRGVVVCRRGPKFLKAFDIKAASYGFDSLKPILFDGGQPLRITVQRKTRIRMMSNGQFKGDTSDERMLSAEAMQKILDKRLPTSGYSMDDPRFELNDYVQEGSQTDEGLASVASLRSGTNPQNLPQPRQGLDVEQQEDFQRLMDEGEALLKEGEQGLDGKLEVGIGERMLNEAANLFASANAIDPLRLSAIEAWGNTLLVHGQLKLRLSEQLQAMLQEAKLKQSYYRKNREKSDRQLGPQPAAIARMLPQVCEECEQLLVEAGRKYRMALSIDKNDVRALYNWGLALCYRGQLIAAEGEENAAKDADKVYLAAIDKFEAMMEIDKKYAPGALLNWGLALRDRSWLRPLGSDERIELLQQSRLKFQDALGFDPNYAQAKMAVDACTADLEELQEYGKESKRAQNQKAENWWDWN